MPVMIVTAWRGRLGLAVPESEMGLVKLVGKAAPGRRPEWGGWCHLGTGMRNRVPGGRHERSS